MNFSEIYLKVINKLLMQYGSVKSIKTNKRSVFLTFDDGPEPEITEFVLNELDKYGFKATFFCKGSCAEQYPELMKQIIVKGHIIGNHTYEHVHAYNRDAASYVEDVERADRVLHTYLFRPPNGCLRLSAWWKLRRKYSICYWTIGSGDWQKETFDYNHNMTILKQTKNGDIILFHFSKELSSGTRQLLPDFLSWLNEKGFQSQTLS